MAGLRSNHTTMSNYEAFTLHTPQYRREYSERDALNVFVEQIWSRLDDLIKNEPHRSLIQGLPKFLQRQAYLVNYDCDTPRARLQVEMDYKQPQLDSIWISPGEWLYRTSYCCILIKDDKGKAIESTRDTNEEVKHIINGLPPALICMGMSPVLIPVETEDTISLQPEDFPHSTMIVVNRRHLAILSDKFIGETHALIPIPSITDNVARAIEHLVDDSITTQHDPPGLDSGWGIRHSDEYEKLKAGFTVQDHILFYSVLDVMGISWGI